MTITLQFNCGSVGELHAEMRMLLGQAATSNRIVISENVTKELEAVKEPEPEPAKTTGPKFTLKDAGGDTHGVYDDEKVLVDDLLDLISLADDADVLKALGDNNEEIAKKLKKANGTKVAKAFREKREQFEAAKEPETKSDPLPETGKADDSAPATTGLTVKAKPAGAEEAIDVPVPDAVDAPTAEQVKAIVSLVMQVEGLALAAAKALLGKYDAARLSEVKPEDFAKVYKDARDLLVKQAGGEVEEADEDPLA